MDTTYLNKLEHLKPSDLKAAMIGDNYFSRRGHLFEGLLKNADNDPIVMAIVHLQLKPEYVLEIGCGNGWRLEAIRERFGSACCGVDPSFLAIKDGIAKFPNLTLSIGSADSLDVVPIFDMVIFGHCLYNCCREDLFTIASEADRVLKDKGHVVVLDFMPEVPYRNPNPDMVSHFSLKMDYSKMFSWHPFYRIIYRNLLKNPEDCLEKIGVIVLEKSSF